MFGTHRISWIKLLFALFLVAGLPIFIWAVATQRIELRKKAATSEPTEICWNRVIFFNNNYNWPNSCKGSPRTDLACSQVLVPLSANEVTGYKSWISAGKPYIPGCGGPAPSTTPAITCNSLANSQPQYFTQCLQAGFPKVCFDKFTGVYQGCNTADYDGCTLHNTNAARNLSCDSSITPPVPGECSPCGPVGPCPGGLVCKSFPVGPGGCTDDGNGHTLCNEPARQWLCVKSDGSSNCPITPTPYPSCTMPPACAYANPSCAYAVQGVTYCPIKPTTTPVSCGPNGATCTITNCPPAPTCPSGTACPRPVCTVQRGICQNNRCVSTYPTPTPSSGC
jgi:hypothetical protein